MSEIASPDSFVFSEAAPSSSPRRFSQVDFIKTSSVLGAWKWQNLSLWDRNHWENSK